jgi:AraC-like DNA-binding protein
VCEALAWYRTVLESRPGAPLGLIAHAADCVQPVADLDRSLVFVMDPSRLNGGGLAGSALEALRQAGVEGRILEEIVREYGPQVLSRRERIEALIARAVSGSTIGRAASDLGIHPDTLARQLKGVGLSARRLRQWARLRGYEHRTRMGMDPGVALAASGWTDQEHRRRAVQRLRER